MNFSKIYVGKSLIAFALATSLVVWSAIASAQSFVELGAEFKIEVPFNLVKLEISFESKDNIDPTQDDVFIEFKPMPGPVTTPPSNPVYTTLPTDCWFKDLFTEEWYRNPNAGVKCFVEITIRDENGGVLASEEIEEWTVLLREMAEGKWRFEFRAKAQLFRFAKLADIIEFSIGEYSGTSFLDESAAEFSP